MQVANWSSSSSRRITASALAARASTIRVRAASGSVATKSSSVSRPKRRRSRQVVAALLGGGVDAFPQAGGGGVEGSEEAVFFVREVLVEGGAGDAGPFDHVLDVGVAVAEFGGGEQHRRDQPLALNGADQVRGKLADAGGEPAVAVRSAARPRRRPGPGGQSIADRRDQLLLAELNSVEGHKETRTFPPKTVQSFVTVPEELLPRAALFDTAAILQADATPCQGSPGEADSARASTENLSLCASAVA